MGRAQTLLLKMPCRAHGLAISRVNSTVIKASAQSKLCPAGQSRSQMSRGAEARTHAPSPPRADPDLPCRSLAEGGQGCCSSVHFTAPLSPWPCRGRAPSAAFSGHTPARLQRAVRPVRARARGGLKEPVSYLLPM